MISVTVPTGSGFRTHRRFRIPTLQLFEINGGLPLNSTVNGTHTLGALLYLLVSPSSLSVGLLRVPILCPLAKTIPNRLPPPLPLLYLRLLLEFSTSDLVSRTPVMPISTRFDCEGGLILKHDWYLMDAFCEWKFLYL